MVSCSDVKRERGREYMPDMAYSRAYETYSPHENLTTQGINYTATHARSAWSRKVWFCIVWIGRNGEISIESIVWIKDSHGLKDYTEGLFFIYCTKLQGLFVLNTDYSSV